VTLQAIPEDAARSTALRAGEVDLIDLVPAAELAALRRDRRFGIFTIPGLRLMFIQLNFGPDGSPPQVTDAAGRPLPGNPFRDPRVRRALSLAIDHQALAAEVMGGAATPTGQWLPSGIDSYDPATPVPPHDPALARRLLAEAGFPEGFRLVLQSPRGRYLGDTQLAEAVAAMWTGIGIRTEATPLPWAIFSARGARLEFGARLAAWRNITGEASYPLSQVLGSYDPVLRRGASNLGRYANPALDALVERATAMPDAAARGALLRQAVRLAAEDVAVIPLVRAENAWAARPGLRYEPRMDELTVAMGLRPE
jgi:peptide/nickel transport system substrate-binding protein